MAKPIVRSIMVDAALLEDVAWLKALAEERNKHNTVVYAFTTQHSSEKVGSEYTQALRDVQQTYPNKNTAAHEFTLHGALDNAFKKDKEAVGRKEAVLFISRDKALLKQAKGLSIQTLDCRDLKTFREALGLNNVQGQVAQIMQLVEDSKHALEKLPHRPRAVLEQKLDEKLEDTAEPVPNTPERESGEILSDATVTEVAFCMAEDALAAFQTFKKSITANETLGKPKALAKNLNALEQLKTTLFKVSEDLKVFRTDYYLTESKKGDGWWLTNFPLEVRCIFGAILTLTVIVPLLSLIFVSKETYMQTFFYQKPVTSAHEANIALDDAVKELNLLITGASATPPFYHFDEPAISAPMHM